MSNPKDKRILVNFGSGPATKPTDWIDYDGSLNASINRLPLFVAQLLRRSFALVSRGRVYEFPRHVRYLRLAERIRLPTDYADVVFASHVWEHLYRDDAEAVTRECRRILKPGGVLRLIVPDLRVYCERYISGGNPAAAEELNDALLFYGRRAPRGLVKRLMLCAGNLHTHKFMYDGPALVRLVEVCGFVEAHERELYESAVPEIRQVESPERGSRGAGVIVECRKPGN